MLIASAVKVKKIKFVNGNMIVTTAHYEQEIKNSLLKYYAIDGIIYPDENCNFICWFNK